jgi:hypothetical protein
VGEIEGWELGSEAFAQRFGDLLTAARRASNCSCRTLAKRSGGRFDVTQLHELERGAAALTEELIVRSGELYGVPIESIVAGRRDVHVGSEVISVGSAAAAFVPGDPLSILSTYLRLVRELRRQHRAPSVELRRDDIEHLAELLERDGEWVVDELAQLMGVTRAQHRSMVGLFKRGAAVIEVAEPPTHG